MVRIQEDREQFKTRLDVALHQRLKDAAVANNRSTNAEIVARLEASFGTPASLDGAISSLIDRHVEAEVTRRLQAIASQIGGA